MVEPTNPPARFIAAAIAEAMKSPCAKSKRGVVIWRGHDLLSRGWNAPPDPFICDGSAACRESCNKLAVHAEVDALLQCSDPEGASMLHVKVVDGRAVTSGGPSCWQCSRVILAAGIAWVWLLHEDGWRRYSAVEFHALTLAACGLPDIRRPA